MKCKQCEFFETEDNKPVCTLCQQANDARTAELAAIAQQEQERFLSESERQRGIK